MYWEEQQSLVLSDLHFGKTGHFRKSGIGVPQSLFKEDLQRLFSLVQFFKPRQLIIAGDMFHSHENKEMDLFKRWRNDISSVGIQLIKGNHDILTNDFYQSAGISVIPSSMEMEGFSFVHDPFLANDLEPKNLSYSFCGHIHPGIHIRTGSRQSMSFPCYYFGEEYAILPAFSRFTGYVNIKPKTADSVYAIVNQSLLQVQ